MLILDFSMQLDNDLSPSIKISMLPLISLIQGCLPVLDRTIAIALDLLSVTANYSARHIRRYKRKALNTLRTKLAS